MKALALAVIVLSPNPAHFGELVTAKVLSGSTPSFAPFSVREHHGSTYVLQCLDPVCVPGPNARTIKIGNTRAVILPHTTSAEVAHPLRSFRRQTELRPPAYAIRPGLLRGLLFAAAALLIVLAALLAVPVARRLIPKPRDDRTPLQRALDLVRASLRLNGEQRRRALDVLGRTLDHDPRAREAFDLAWSKAPPEKSRVEKLVDEVESRT